MIRAASLCVLLALCACMKAPDPSEQAAAGTAQGGLPEGHPPLDAAAADFAPDPAAPRPKFSMDALPGWKAVEPGMSFYLAKYELEAGGVCTVSWNVGDVEVNLQRWLGQFQVPSGDPRKEAIVGRLSDAVQPTTTIEVAGTLTATRSVGGGPPREDWMLLGAVLDTSVGPVFIKALGPRSVLQPVTDDFRRMAAGARVGT